MERSISFLKFPRELISQLVNDWLKWEDVARWDTANCNKEHREEWLDMLKTDCVTPWTCIGYSPSASPLMHIWSLARCVRSRELYFEEKKGFDAAAMIRWLENTGSSLEKLCIFNLCEEGMLSSIIRHCGKLKGLTFCCRIDDAHWKYINTLSALEKLHISNYVRGAPMIVPMNLTFLLLHSLEIRWDSFNDEDALLLIRQLPALQSLRFTHYYLSDICTDLAAACFRVVKFDIENSSQYSYFTNTNDEFVHLMSSFENGLQYLILSSMQCFYHCYLPRAKFALH